MAFRNDFHDANVDWNFVKPELLQFIKGDLFDIESNNSVLADIFDKYSGIDAIHMVQEQIRGVAIRVQWGVDYKTFSIRYSRPNGVKTEYHKREEAITGNRGFWYPYLTIQMYLERRYNTPRILSCGIVRTVDLYDYIRENFAELISHKKRSPEGQFFLVVPFYRLKEAGKKILIFSHEGAEKRETKPSPSAMTPPLYIIGQQTSLFASERASIWD